MFCIYINYCTRNLIFSAMKKSIFVILFCGSLLATSQITLAQDSNFGIGAIINNPTGVSLKAFVSEDIAIDGALSFSLENNFSQVYLHADVLQHGDAIESDILQLYYGLGIRLIWNDVTDDLNAGLRGPIGTEYSFEGTSLKSFIEIVPTLDFSPDARFFFGGALGMRVYLN